MSFTLYNKKRLEEDIKSLSDIVEKLDRIYERIDSVGDGFYPHSDLSIQETAELTKEFEMHNKETQNYENEFQMKFVGYMERGNDLLDLPRNVIDYIIEEPVETLDMISKISNGDDRVKKENEFKELLSKYGTDADTDWYQDYYNGVTV